MTARQLTLQHLALYAAMLYIAATADDGDFEADFCGNSQLDARFDLQDPDAPEIDQQLFIDLEDWDLISAVLPQAIRDHEAGWHITREHPLGEHISYMLFTGEGRVYRRIRWLFDLAFPRKSMPLYDMLQDIPAFVSGPVTEENILKATFGDRIPQPGDRLVVSIDHSRADDLSTTVIASIPSDEPKRLIIREVVTSADPEYRHDPLS